MTVRLVAPQAAPIVSLAKRLSSTGTVIRQARSMAWFGWPALFAALVVIAAAGATAIGARRWARATQALAADLEAARVTRSAASPTRYDARELEGLPLLVQRYFCAVLEDGQPLVCAATVEMTGRFNMSATGERWRRFSSRQRVTTRRPGFLWDARISMAPGLAVRVVDSYIAGNGLLHAALQGLYTVGEIRGGGAIARGEFMRYFAEAPWYPTALLPSQGVRWESVDAHSATATLADGPIALTLLFRFDEAGLIASFRAESRGSMVDKVMVYAPWEGRFSNYRKTEGGMSVPFTGEVAWMRSDGRKPYFIGTVESLQYEFAL